MTTGCARLIIVESCEVKDEMLESQVTRPRKTTTQNYEWRCNLVVTLHLKLSHIHNFHDWEVTRSQVEVTNIFIFKDDKYL